MDTLGKRRAEALVQYSQIATTRWERRNVISLSLSRFHMAATERLFPFLVQYSLSRRLLQIDATQMIAFHAELKRPCWHDRGLASCTIGVVSNLDTITYRSSPRVELHYRERWHPLGSGQCSPTCRELLSRRYMQHGAPLSPHLTIATPLLYRGARLRVSGLDNAEIPAGAGR